MGVSERDQSYVIDDTLYTGVDSMELLRVPFLLITPFKSMLATMKDQIFTERLYTKFFTDYMWIVNICG